MYEMEYIIKQIIDYYLMVTNDAYEYTTCNGKNNLKF